MKTRAKNILKGLFMLALVSTVFVSCGKNNSSGGGGGSSSSDPWSGGVTAAGNGSKLLSDWRNRIFNEYRCQTFNQNGAQTNKRLKLNVQSPGPVQLNAGALHVGVSTEGDVLIMSNSNNQVRIELYACERPAPQQSAQFIQTPILNQSSMCSISEVSAADIFAGSNQGAYHLVFFPIGLSGGSSLCQNGPQFQ